MEIHQHTTSMKRIFLTILLLLAIVFVLQTLPAMLFNAYAFPVIASETAYLVFFLSGAVVRTVRFGSLAKQNVDKQTASRSGRAAFAVRFVGIFSLHWVSIFQFSQHPQLVTGLQVAGVALFGLGLLTNQLAIWKLGRFWDKLVIKDGHRIVQDGIYGLVRHPIYTSYILLFCGFVCVMQSWWGLLILAVTGVIWFGSRITIEEKMLTDEFGSEYDTYKARTKKLLPFIY
jgi:protein-S-isoprenylcysteine O-methyltransferase Ste14